ncbi:hypothetical protein K474DRAFT_1671550 [Panus rudis PR-1116 ss-1]|nr:hypothetical protein K474DRAFT_1671550 [Panus rudis PR-1116 ss-1]
MKTSHVGDIDGIVRRPNSAHASVTATRDCSAIWKCLVEEQVKTAIPFAISWANSEARRYHLKIKEHENVLLIELLSAPERTGRRLPQSSTHDMTISRRGLCRFNTAVREQATYLHENPLRAWRSIRDVKHFVSRVGSVPDYARPAVTYINFHATVTVVGDSAEG